MKNNKKIKIGSMSPKLKMQQFMKRFRELQGDPDYIARGMAVGIFIAITPTIPFHTSLAIILAFMVKGSKPAAMIGVWFSNPITIPLFYIASYKAGAILIGNQATEFAIVASLLDELGNPSSFSIKCQLILNFLKQEMDIFYAMILGGTILGIPPGIASYFITRKIVVNIRLKYKS